MALNKSYFPKIDLCQSAFVLKKKRIYEFVFLY